MRSPRDIYLSLEALFCAARRIFALTFTAVTIAACGSLTNIAGPPTSFDVDKDIQQLEERFKLTASVDGYYSKPETAERRNEFIGSRLTLYNLEYIKYIRQLAVDKAHIDTVLDLTKIGVDLAITLTGTAATKAILGAVSAGLTGSRISIERNYFQEKTVGALISEMNAKRTEALIPILAGTKKNLSEYSITEAIVDLQKYYEAGTFPGAISSIQQVAGVRQDQAEQRIALLRVSAYGEDDSSRIIVGYVWKDGRRVSDNGVAVAPLSDRHAQVTKWVQANVGDIPLQKFLDSPVLGNARRQMIEDLSIPKQR